MHLHTQTLRSTSLLTATGSSETVRVRVVQLRCAHLREAGFSTHAPGPRTERGEPSGPARSPGLLEGHVSFPGGDTLSVGMALF